MYRLLLAAVILGCSGGGSAPPPADTGGWQLGPVINGQNLSSGSAVVPTPQGFSIDIPPSPGSVHYVTYASGPLDTKTFMRMRFRVEGTGRIVPVDLPQLTSMLTLYFERANLCWTIECEPHRWYALDARLRPLVNGEHELIAMLGARWGAVQSSTSESAPQAFADAKASAGRAGFVLGGGNGVGHGVTVFDGTARIVVTQFTVE